VYRQFAGQKYRERGDGEEGKGGKEKGRDASSTASGDSKRGESKLSSRNPLRKSRSMSLKG
jgi:hypothetical protein